MHGCGPARRAGSASSGVARRGRDQRESLLATSHTQSYPQLPAPHANGDRTGNGDARGASEWLILLLWRQKWVLVLTLLLALAAAYGYLRVAPKFYASTIKLTVRQIGGPTTGIGGTPPAASAVFVGSEVEQIKGDKVLGRAAANLGRKYTVRQLREVVDAEMDRTTENITVSAISPARDEAVRLVEAVAEAYKQTRAQLAADPAGPERQLEREYQEKRRGIDAELAVLEPKLRDLQARYGPDVRKDERQALKTREFDYYLQELRRAEREKDDADAAADQARKAAGRSAAPAATPPVPAVGPTTAPAATRPASMPATFAARAVDPLEEEMGIDLTSPDELASLRAQILQLQAQLQGLERRYLPEHPAVLAARQQLGRLNRQYLAAAEQRARRAGRDYDRVARQLEGVRTDLRQIDAGAEQFRSIKSDVERLRALRNTFDVRAREAQFAGIDVRRFDGPTLPDDPTLPDPRKAYGVAVALALVLGILLAAAREWLDDRMRSAGEARLSLGVPLLGVIPQSGLKRSFSVGGQRVLLDPASDAAEAYRSLKNAIGFAAPDGFRTLLVASPNSGDGKTTLATNLGIAMAQAGRRVCLVDADLRKPSVHDVFGLRTTLGLTTLLSGRSTLDAAVQHTSVGGLDVLPCGPVPANPAEVLNSQEFVDAIEDLADRYDVVLLDSPPVGSAGDARVIAATCDATLLVLTARSARRRQTERARDALRGVGARVIGMVVNDVPRKDASYYGTSKSLRHVVPGLTSQEHDILQVRK